MEQTKKGVLKVVAKSGGIILEGDEKWFNPSFGAKQNILDNLEDLKKLKGKKVVLLMTDKDYVFEGVSEVKPESVTEEKVGNKQMSDSEAKALVKKVEADNKVKESTKSTEVDYVTIKGKKHYLYKALLRMAREKGLVSLTVINSETDFKSKSALCHCKAAYKDGTHYEAIGSSTPDNTGTMTKEHYVEMANTRAMSRALRFSLGIGDASAEEMDMKD